MDIQLFFGVLGYKPIKFLKEPLRTHYMFKILTHIEEQMARRPYNDYSKYFLYLSFRKLDAELVKFIKSYSKEIETENLDYFRKLLNLTRNIKRVVYVQKTKTFPSCFSELTTESLTSFIKEYGRLHSLKTEPEILMLKDTKYIDEARQLEKEALNYYEKNLH